MYCDIVIVIAIDLPCIIGYPEFGYPTSCSLCSDQAGEKPKPQYLEIQGHRHLSHSEQEHMFLCKLAIGQRPSLENFDLESHFLCINDAAYLTAEGEGLSACLQLRFTKAKLHLEDMSSCSCFHFVFVSSAVFVKETFSLNQKTNSIGKKRGREKSSLVQTQCQNLAATFTVK